MQILCRLFIAFLLVLKIPFPENARSDSSKVCVRDSAAALYNTLKYHHHEVSQMAKMRGVQLPRLSEKDELLIRQYIQKYLSDVPDSALIVYAADQNFNCAFLWKSNFQKPIYSRQNSESARFDIASEGLRGGILRSNIRGELAPRLKRDGSLISFFSNLLNKNSTSKEVSRADDTAVLSRSFFPERFRPHLREIKHLSIVSVRGMSTVPIGMLEPLGDGRKTVEMFSVNFVAFIADIAKSDQVWPRAFNNPLIVGNPLSSNDPDWTLPSLPGAEKEAVEAYNQFGGKLLKRNAAVEKSVMRLIDDADLIYFAAHGISDPDDPLDGSFIALSDGRLTAREVQTRKFYLHPLVILSACQTGLGKVLEAGVVGIARAFQKANAGNTVMSLWNVDDAATLHLMTAFRNHIKVHMPAEAMRRAMLDTRKSYPKPAHWAAFNVFGNHSRTLN